MRHEESKIQQVCVKWFRYHYPEYSKLLFAVPNGGSRRRIEGAIMKAEGVTAGVADLLLLVPNTSHHGLCVEMKTEKGKQQPTQKEWQTKVERVGYKYVICRSLDDFIDEIDEYLK